MKKLKVLLIQFEDPIYHSELRAFRSAIIEKAGRNHILFHNHLDDKEYLYRYPKIQYKISNRLPTIVCINEGVDEIHHFFSKPSWDLLLYERPYKVKVKKLQVNQFNMLLLDNINFDYRIHNWYALNQKNYKKYMLLTSPYERKAMLETILIGNILSFAKGIDWKLDKEIKVSINNVKEKTRRNIRNLPVLSFDIDFTANIFLPNYIGLGKNVSYGFGIVKQLKKQKNNE